MAAQLVEWGSPRQAKERLGKRLRAAKDHRKRLLEDEWRSSERAAFGGYADSDAVQQQVRQLVEDTADFDLGETIEINYAFRNLRYLAAQMSANPPVATPRPESSDLEDRRAADAAAQCMQWFLRQFQLQEKVDLVALDTLVYGTGIGRSGWNPNGGEIVEFDEDTGELTMEGEIEFVRVSPWSFYMDPGAQTWGEVRYVFEEITMSADEVRSHFPKKLGLFRANRTGQSRMQVSGSGPTSESSILQVDTPEDKEQKYVFYAYFEPGLPENGMLGRFCYCFEDGTLITPPTVNPNQHRPSPSLKQRQRYRVTGRKPKRKPARAYLPYHLLTDIDVPGQVWGRSFLHYVGPAQNLMRNLDSATLEAVKAHGVFRMVLPPNAKLADDAISNSSIEVVQVTDDGDAGWEPKFIAPPGLPPAMTELRQNMRAGIDDLAGMNESMLGQQSREQSGFAMQYAVNQGSMIRRRLFNKYVLFVESMYRALLRLAIQHWDDPKMIKVLGNENAFDVLEMRGIDIDGGYEIVTEYGTSLSLDPQTRRDDLLKLVPVFKEAGLDPKVLVANLPLADIKSTEDVLKLARTRMKEVIDTMVAENRLIQPRKYQDHAGMLAYCREYVMTSEYAGLPSQYQALVEQHMTLRAELAAQEAQGPASLASNTSSGAAPTAQQAGPGGAGGALPNAPIGGAPPAPGAPGSPSPTGMPTPPVSTPQPAA